MPIKPDQLSRADFSPTYKGVELEIPDELPRRILPLFWMFARPFKWPILWQLLMSVTLFVIISMQIYAAKNIADTAMTVDTNNPQAFWLVFEPFKLMLFMFALSVCAEWGSWFGTYRGRIKMLSRARQIVFSYVQRHNVTYFDDMLTGKVAHRVMLMPEQIVTLYERVCWIICLFWCRVRLLWRCFIRSGLLLPGWWGCGWWSICSCPCEWDGVSPAMEPSTATPVPR